MMSCISPEFVVKQIKVLPGHMVSIQKHSVVFHLEKRVCLCAAMSATCAVSASATCRTLSASWEGELEEKRTESHQKGARACVVGFLLPCVQRKLYHSLISSKHL